MKKRRLLPVLGLLGLSTAFVTTAPSLAMRPAADSAAVTPAAVTLAVNPVDVGAGPAIAYTRAKDVTFLEGRWRLHRPDGTSVRLPRMTWSSYASLGRGAVAMTGTEAGPLLQVVNGRGRVTHEEHVRQFGLVASPDRSVVAWLDDSDQVTGFHEGRLSFALSRIPHARSIDAILGEDSCQEDFPEGGGCMAYADVRRGGHRQVWYTSSHGIVDRVRGPRSVTDASVRGEVVGRQGGGDHCSAFYKLSGRLGWTACDLRLRAFSPDGDHLLATGNRADHRAQHRLALLDRSGTSVQSFTLAGTGNGIDQWVWEDADHVLAVVHEDDDYAVLRLGLDGSVERATDVVHTDGGGYAPYGLPVR